MSGTASDLSRDKEAIGEVGSCVAVTASSWTGGETDMEATLTEGKGETCSSLEADTIEGKGETCSSMAQTRDAATLKLIHVGETMGGVTSKAASESTVERTGEAGETSVSVTNDIMACSSMLSMPAANEPDEEAPASTTADTWPTLEAVGSTLSQPEGDIGEQWATRGTLASVYGAPDTIACSSVHSTPATIEPDEESPASTTSGTWRTLEAEDSTLSQPGGISGACWPVALGGSGGSIG
jgi:hypothetical protein